jgi:hypothetical protein
MECFRVGDGLNGWPWREIPSVLDTPCIGHARFLDSCIYFNTSTNHGPDSLSVPEVQRPSTVNRNMGVKSINN